MSKWDFSDQRSTWEKFAMIRRMRQRMQKFAHIGKPERMQLELGAFAGMILMYYASHSWLLSLIIGVPFGVGGAAIAILVGKLIFGEHFLPSPSSLGKKQRISAGLNIGLAMIVVALLSYLLGELSSEFDVFDVIVMVLLYFAILCNFFYACFGEVTRKDRC